ncbi:uncharacterized protein LOC128958705 [Oppia nitens]|uniref:uncharacterized protein LOC128958705 n=1 Tax=Oppia nitens TaxID=1686743 RepID=UPI0023DAD869|nr:uncharacterized protein LOC128958705 [Oppia nitens]
MKPEDEDSDAKIHILEHHIPLHNTTTTTTPTHPSSTNPPPLSPHSHHRTHGHHHHHHHHHNHRRNHSTHSHTGGAAAADQCPVSHNHSGSTHSYSQRPIELVFQNISVSIESKSMNNASSSTSSSSSSPSKSPQERPILRDISGYAKPGQLLAVMGPSGSGKTTLLSTLSGRLKPQCGCITLNGEAINKQLRRKICYVLQQDIFFPSLTLRQTLIYTAQLRLPDSINYNEKLSHVEKIIDILDLRHCQDTIIGDIIKRGLSGGEKKRANIACELLTNPNILLIDEPTSGLDSSTAHSLMQTLKDYAVKEKKTIVATLHQPSSQMFYMIDKLLLLCSGRSAYFGDVRSVVPFFSGIGLEITAHYNPADFVMEKVKNPGLQEKIIEAAKALPKSPSDEEESDDDDCRPNHISRHIRRQISSYRQEVDEEEEEDAMVVVVKSRDRSPAFHHSDASDDYHHHYHHVDDNDDNHSPSQTLKQSPNDDNMHVVVTIHDTDDHKDYDSGRSSWSQTDRSSSSTFSSNCSYGGAAAADDNLCANSVYYATTKNGRSDQKWPTSFWTQLRVLTKRNFYEARHRMLSKLNWIQTIALALVAGLIWFQVVRTEDTLDDVRGWMFFTTTYWMLFALFGALISFPAERDVINKERSSGAYRLSSYYIAKMIGELPLTITLPSVFFIISYPMLGWSNITTFLSLWAFLILSTVCAQSVGLFIGALCNDLEVSVTLSALYSLSTMLFAGYYSATMPGWLSWMRYCSIVYYALLNMQMSEFFSGLPIPCSTKMSKFLSCKLNATDSAVATIGDSLITGTTTSAAATIPYDELSAQLDIMNDGSEPLPIWFNTLVLIIFLITFRLMGYLVLRYYRKPK